MPRPKGSKNKKELEKNTLEILVTEEPAETKVEEQPEMVEINGKWHKKIRFPDGSEGVE